MGAVYFEQQDVYIKLYKLYKLTSISIGVLVVFQVSVVCIISVLAACPLFCQLHPNLKCLRGLQEYQICIYIVKANMRLTDNILLFLFSLTIYSF